MRNGNNFFFVREKRGIREIRRPCLLLSDPPTDGGVRGWKEIATYETYA